MRISDRTTARNYLRYMDKARTDYAATNERIASQTRFRRLSEDVSAGTRVLRTRTDLFKAEKQLDNVKSVNEEMATTETAMTAMSEILNNLHAKSIVGALNDPKGEGREAIANEVKIMKQELLQLANTKYGQRYVMGGSNASNVAPFTMDANGKMLYNGIDVDSIYKNPDGKYAYKDAAGDEVLVPMEEPVFMDIGLGIRKKGSTMDPGSGFQVSYSGLDVLGVGLDAKGHPNNMFNLLTEIENNIRNYDREKLGELDTKVVEMTDKFRANLTDIGAKTGFLDTMEDRLKSSVDLQKKKIDNLMGVNDAEEATRQTMNDYVLKAVVQMGARILPVSLMDFLR